MPIIVASPFIGVIIGAENKFTQLGPKVNLPMYVMHKTESYSIFLFVKNLLDILLVWLRCSGDAVLGGFQS